jgi:putative tryptophan/tyrosine transport system substrate-binding protein
VVRAQQGDRLRRVGVLLALAETDPEAQRWVAAFLQELQKMGWQPGRNVRIEYLWAVADPDRIQAYAAELVGQQPDVIVANNASVVAALQRETRTLPIVFTQINDPVGSGFVASLAHPSGNITGFTPGEFSMFGKFAELLKQIAPGVTQAAVSLS